MRGAGATGHAAMTVETTQVRRVFLSMLFSRGHLLSVELVRLGYISNIGSILY